MRITNRNWYQLLLAPLLALSLTACPGEDDPTMPLALGTPVVSFTDPQSTYDLSNYIQTGRFRLPVGAGANLLAREASAISFNRDTGTLFIVGDGGTSVTQVNKQGVLIDSMTLAVDASKPSGTYFFDTEGIAYIGGGKFVLVEERFRQVNEFTYAANTTLAGVGVRTVKLGTTIGNIGIEGITFDPSTNGYIAVKESGPSGVFQTTVDFAAGTASNGSPTTDNSVNLFDPARTGLTALNDVFALSNVLPTAAPDYSHIMILSAPDGKVVKMDRTGKILSTLVVGSAGQNEGMTMDTSGNLYVVGELGCGTNCPEMLVFSPTVSKDAVGLASNVYLTFNQPVFLGAGNVTLSNGAGDTRTIAIGDATQVTISGNTVTVNPTANLLAGHTYSVTFPAGLIKDAQGNNSPGVSNNTTLTFTAAGTIDTTAPTLASSSPADDATGISTSSVALTFNEPVVAGSGNIVISNGAGDTRTIAVGDAQVVFNGNTVTITLTAELLKGVTYNVQLASGVIKDIAGNAFAGITNATALNFATAPALPTVLAPGDLLFLAANSSGTSGSATVPDSYAFVLMKAVNAGTLIGFTDRDYTGTAFPLNEAAYIWTADVAYPAGTIITILPDSVPPTASKGTLQGAGGGLSATAETIYAFQGTIANLTATTAGAITATQFIAAINLGTAAGTIPAELAAAGAFISFPLDNAKYNGSLDRSNLVTFAALVKNSANWLNRDTTVFPITGNSLFPGE